MKRHEVWVGVLVLAAVISTVTILFAITNPAFFRGRYEVTMLVDDAQGLRRGDPVRMRGVNVGRVRGFSLKNDGVAIGLELERRYPVPRDSRIVLTTTSVLGDKAAEILPGKSQDQLQGGDVVKGGAANGNDLSGSMSGIAQEAGDALDRVKDLLSPETVENVEESSAEAKELLQDLNRLSGQLRSLVSGLSDATEGPTLDNIESASGRLEELAQNLDHASLTATALLTRVQRGEGTLGKLSRDESLYRDATMAAQSVSKAAAAIQELAADIRKNPGRYVKISVF
jgi:phospholipid/cholesterol/gamma-HCH transport system substrate-binding protein